MTLFDVFVLAVVAASVVAGAVRGFVRALIVGISLIAGLIFAARGYDAAGGLLRTWGVVDSPAPASAGGFILIVCLALVAGFLLGGLARAGLRQASLEWFDRVLGAGFGLVRGVAVCSAFYLALTAFPVRLESVAEARTAPALAESARLLSFLTTAEIREHFYAEYRRLFASSLPRSDRQEL
jgi:membrane protein required for colicin V production